MATATPRLDPGSRYAKQNMVLDGRYVRPTLTPDLRPHPLEDSKHRVYLHRAVLFDAIGVDEHDCHWCKYGGLEWGLPTDDVACLMVDHIDGNPLNCTLANLVPAHAWCNNNRAVIEREEIGWEPWYTVPPVERPELRQKVAGTATPAARELVDAPPPPQPAGQRKVPIRDGWFTFDDQLGRVPRYLLDQFPQMHRLDKR